MAALNERDLDAAFSTEGVVIGHALEHFPRMDRSSQRLAASTSASSMRLGLADASLCRRLQKPSETAHGGAAARPGCALRARRTILTGSRLSWRLWSSSRNSASERKATSRVVVHLEAGSAYDAARRALDRVEAATAETEFVAPELLEVNVLCL